MASVMITTIQGTFIKVMKLSVSILEADSVHLCHLQLCFSIDRIRSIYGRKQILMTSYVMEIACIYNCSYAKYLVYLTFALDRQKILSIIVLIIRRCVSQCYSLYLLFSLTVVNFSNYYNYIYSQRICNLCK